VGDGTYRDPDFDRNWAGIHAAGMIRGAYLFFRPTSSASAQAALINAAVGHLGAGDLPVTIDVECMCPASVSPNCNSGHSGCVSPAAAAGVLRDLVAQVAAGTGKTPMVYTGAWFWDGGTYLSGAITLPGNPLWVSGYTTGCVSVPSGWTDWRFWQYTDGTCAGCPSVTLKLVERSGGCGLDRGGEL
jgi:GH25 family lysozyme M1 (1,4-beta-N-acetylmuramidase)